MIIEKTPRYHRTVKKIIKTHELTTKEIEETERLFGENPLNPVLHYKDITKIIRTAKRLLMKTLTLHIEDNLLPQALKSLQEFITQHPNSHISYDISKAPSDRLQSAIHEVKSGDVVHYDNVEHMLKDLK